jgi:glycosyltransferase involved in cell wall biosynthesis
MARTHVCMVVNNLDVGGLEKVVLSLLAHLDQRAFELSIVCLKGPGKLFGELELPDAARLVLRHDRVVDFGVMRMDPWALWALRRWIVERRVDVLHVHNFGPLIYGGLAAALSGRRRPKVVYSEHNQINSASKSDLEKFKWYVKLADHVVAVSQELERQLTKDLCISTPVRVIHNGIDGARFDGVSGERVRAELGVAEGELVVGTAVVLSKQKGLTHLLAAAPEVLRRVPHARFVVAGDGPLRDELEAEHRASGLGDRFRFVGYRRDIPELLSAYDVYVLPSLWEGLPLALLEAMRLGKPIVCTRVGGNAEVVLDGEGGRIVPPADPKALADALVATLEDRAFRERARETNQARFFERFSVQSMTRAHEALFRELVGR